MLAQIFTSSVPLKALISIPSVRWGGRVHVIMLNCEPSKG